MVRLDFDFPAWALILVLFVVLSLGLAGLGIERNTEAIAVAHRALCGQKLNYISSIHETDRYLKKHSRLGRDTRELLLKAKSIDMKQLRGFEDVHHCG